MRMKFHEQLDTLTESLASMCRLAGVAIVAATDALVEADLPAAERVFDLGEQIEVLRGPCEEQATALLALQAPVARDLRQVITGVHLVTDLHRMGGLAQHVAKSVRRRPGRMNRPEFDAHLLSWEGDPYAECLSSRGAGEGRAPGPRTP